MGEMMKVVIVEPQKRPYVKEIEHTLRELQRIAGDTIQVVYPFHDRVGIICDDEGKLNGKPLNRCLYDDNGKPYDIIAGTFIVTGLSEDDFCSLSPEYIEKYMEYYKVPQTFIQTFSGIIVLPMEDKELKNKNMSIKERMAKEKENANQRHKRVEEKGNSRDIEL